MRLAWRKSWLGDRRGELEGLLPISIGETREEGPCRWPRIPSLPVGASEDGVGPPLGQPKEWVGLATGFS